jgi:hypothetical protein
MKITMLSAELPCQRVLEGKLCANPRQFVEILTLDRVRLVAKKEKVPIVSNVYLADHRREKAIEFDMRDFSFPT